MSSLLHSIDIDGTIIDSTKILSSAAVSSLGLLLIASTVGGPPCYSVIITLTGHNFLTTHTTNAGHKAAPRWQKPLQWVFKLQFL